MSAYLVRWLACLGLAATGVQAGELPGLRFTHHDWELVCDNTRTCRAAGYQREGAELNVSVLLTRHAGPRQPVTAEFMLGDYGEDAQRAQPSGPAKLAMLIDKRPMGTVQWPNPRLSTRQTAALVAALASDSSITWSFGEQTWILSDKGAAAVLLKMDEFQGRVGTTGALIRRGPRDEGGVLPPLPPALVVAVPPLKNRPGDERLFKPMPKALLDALRSTLGKEDYCPDVMEGADEPGQAPDWAVDRLTERQVLLSGRCWRGAYNLGTGYWVVSDVPPYRPTLVTTSGSEYGGGAISAAHKGRGLGDCWSRDEWVWDGSRFVHTESTTTGMCKLISPGGAWSLPLIVTGGR